MVCLSLLLAFLLLAPYTLTAVLALPAGYGGGVSKATSKPLYTQGFQVPQLYNGYAQGGMPYYNKFSGGYGGGGGAMPYGYGGAYGAAGGMPYGGGMYGNNMLQRGLGLNFGNPGVYGGAGMGHGYMGGRFLPSAGGYAQTSHTVSKSGPGLSYKKTTKTVKNAGYPGYPTLGTQYTSVATHHNPYAGGYARYAGGYGHNGGMMNQLGGGYAGVNQMGYGMAGSAYGFGRPVVSQHKSQVSYGPGGHVASTSVTHQAVPNYGAFGMLGKTVVGPGYGK